MAQIDTGFDRIQAIGWDHPPVEDDDHRMDLMRAFQSAARSCARRVGVSTGTIFDCFAKAVDPGLTIPKSMAHYIAGEPVRGNGLAGSSYVEAGLSSFLHWCALMDAYPKTPDGEPYEALIRFFEEGGKIYVEHGMFLEVNENRKHGFNIRVYPGC
jgi:hypothetical protein